MKKSIENAIVGIGFVIIFVWLGMMAYTFWFEDVFTMHRKNQVHRDALTALHQKINLGDGWQQVFSNYYATRSDRLSLGCDSASFWTVSMPKEFGSKGWMLFIAFTNERVSHVQMRTTDGPKPEHSPPDK